MRVTTGGITVTVGVAIVVALGAAGLWVVREEGDDGPSVEEQQCVSQPEAQARRAQRAFMTRFVEPDPDQAAAWYVGVGLSNRAAANDAIESSEDRGLPASDPLPASVGDDVVLLVLYDRTKELPTLPSCIEDTPVAYVSTGGPVQPD